MRCRHRGRGSSQRCVVNICSSNCISLPIPTFISNDVDRIKADGVRKRSASLRQLRPDGVYVGLTGDPTEWTGVLFVRKGPYAPAILRFRITFPTSFPDQVPLITFTTDIFHPLVTPLTIRTHTTLSSLDGESSSGVDDDRMPPGGFNLRAGFPAHSKASSTWGDSTSKATPKLTVYEVLCYVRAAFEDEALLNDLPPEAAGDPGAWQAWQTHRRRTKTTVSRIGDGEDDTSPALSEESDDEREVSTLAGPRPSATLPARPRRPEEWNWEGVWETRVRKGIEGSLAEPVLYGQVVGDESIQFLNLDAEAIETIKENMKRSLRSTGS